MTRSAATGRTAATNRVAVQDMKASLAFNGTSSLVDLGKPAAMQALADQTFSAWVKTYGGKSAIYSNGYSSSTQGQALILGSSATPGLSGRIAWFQGASVVLSTSPVNALELGRWVHVTATQAGNTAKIYVNGALNRTASLTQTVPDVAKNSYLGCEALGPISSLKGCISTARLWNRALTADEVLANMQDQPPRDGLIGEWLLNEGAGTTAYDTSGNGNHGTITAGTYTADVPTKKRELVGGNLVKNGDFEFAPPFTAATSVAGRYIDGTAGSLTNSIFGWAGSFITFPACAAFDTSVVRTGSSSMRLSTINALGNIVVGQSLAASNPTANEARNIMTTVLPNTSYTLTAWVKTNNVATNAVWVDMREFSGSRVAGTTTPTSKLSGTNDWTRVTATVTTAATTQYIGVLLRNNVAGNISDAWFDDITLTPTTNTTRTAV